MLKAYLSVICASLILADMCRYHAQLSTVASYIDMISVIFIKGKLLKLHAPMSIHAMSISMPSQCQLLFGQFFLCAWDSSGVIIVIAVR